MVIFCSALLITIRTAQLYMEHHGTQKWRVLLQMTFRFKRGSLEGSMLVIG